VCAELQMLVGDWGGGGNWGGGWRLEGGARGGGGGRGKCTWKSKMG